MKNILILAPHPDDETLGTGGIIAIRSREGYDIHIAVLTDGSGLFRGKFGEDSKPSPSEISELRKRETERTVKLMGGDPDLIRYLDYRDGSLKDNIEEVAQKVKDIIEELNPEEVYSPDHYENHPDHNATNDIAFRAMELFENKPKLIQYFLSIKWDLTFDDVKEEITEIDISEFYELKKEALSMFDCHHKITVEGQTEPLVTDNFAHYLDYVERVILP